MVEESKQKGEAETAANGKLTWDEYSLYAGFYRFFLDFGLKANVFFYGITGAILTILYNPTGGAGQNIEERFERPVLRILLATPFLISLVLAGK